MDETSALLWSTEENGVLVNLTKDNDGMPKVKEF
jgi:hypothetical protein